MKWWNTYRILAEKRKHLHWSAEELFRYRSEKLRKLVLFAYKNSPFYRQFYDKYGVSPDVVQGEGDINRLPILEKKDLCPVDPLEVITLNKQGKPVDEKNLMLEVTSGSTGAALAIKRTWRDLHYTKANDIRAFQQTGFKIYHRQVIVKSSTDTITEEYWFNRLGILRKYYIAVTDDPEYNLAQLKKFRPHHLHGYPYGLVAIAQFLKDKREVLPIPVICTGAEVLDPQMRQLISDSFNAAVFDLYGTREVGNIAWECKCHEGMHINDDSMILEILDENGNEVADGVEGEVLVTHLDGLDYPFIRYRLGDRAVWIKGQCKCGVAFRRLKNLTGRTDACILLPSGEWITGMVFQELRVVPWMSAFRVIQDAPEYVRLQIVPKQKPSDANIEAVKSKASALLKDKVSVKVEIHDKLELDKSGKIRAVICRLPESDIN